jgi:soluble lytic murein transglycosylase-like protein
MNSFQRRGTAYFVPRLLAVLAAVWLLCHLDNLVLGPSPSQPEIPAEQMTGFRPVEDPRVAPLSTFIRQRYHATGEVATHAAVAALHASRETGISATLILAVAGVESGFRPGADNGQDKGIMQVNPKFHPEKVARIGGPSKLLEVGPCIQTGARVLQAYSAAEKGNQVTMLLRYNGATSPNAYPGKVFAEKALFDRVLARN